MPTSMDGSIYTTVYNWLQMLNHRYDKVDISELLNDCDVHNYHNLTSTDFIHRFITKMFSSSEVFDEYSSSSPESYKMITEIIAVSFEFNQASFDLFHNSMSSAFSLLQHTRHSEVVRFVWGWIVVSWFAWNKDIVTKWQQEITTQSLLSPLQSLMIEVLGPLLTDSDACFPIPQIILQNAANSAKVQRRKPSISKDDSREKRRSIQDFCLKSRPKEQCQPKRRIRMPRLSQLPSLSKSPGKGCRRQSEGCKGIANRRNSNREANDKKTAVMEKLDTYSNSKDVLRNLSEENVNLCKQISLLEAKVENLEISLEEKSIKERDMSVAQKKLQQLYQEQNDSESENTKLISEYSQQLTALSATLHNRDEQIAIFNKELQILCEGIGIELEGNEESQEIKTRQICCKIVSMSHQLKAEFSLEKERVAELMEEKNELEKQRNEIASENANHVSELEEVRMKYMQKITQMEEKLQQFEVKKEAEKNRADELTNEINELKNNITTLTRNNRELEHVVDSLKNKCDIHTKNSPYIFDDMATLESTHFESCDLSEKIKEITELQQRLIETEAACNEAIRSEKESKEKVVESCNEKMKELNIKCETEKCRNEILEERIKKMTDQQESDKENISTKEAMYRENIGILEDTINRSNIDRNNLESKNEAQKTEIKRCYEVVGELEAKVENLKIENESTKKHLNELICEIESLRNIILKKTLTINEMRAMQKETLEKYNQERMKEKTQWENTLSLLEDEKSQIEEEMKKILREQRESNHESEYIECLKQIQKANSIIESRNESIQHLEKEVTKYKELYDENLKDLEFKTSKMYEYEDKLKASHAEAEEANENLKVLRGHIMMQMSLDNEIKGADTNRDIESLCLLIGSKKQEYEAYCKKIEDLNKLEASLLTRQSNRIIEQSINKEKDILRSKLKSAEFQKMADVETICWLKKELNQQKYINEQLSKLNIELISRSNGIKGSATIEKQTSHFERLTVRQSIKTKLFETRDKLKSKSRDKIRNDKADAFNTYHNRIKGSPHPRFIR